MYEALYCVGKFIQNSIFSAHKVTYNIVDVAVQTVTTSAHLISSSKPNCVVFLLWLLIVPSVRKAKKQGTRTWLEWGGAFSWWKFWTEVDQGNKEGERRMYHSLTSEKKVSFGKERIWTDTDNTIYSYVYVQYFSCRSPSMSHIVSDDWWKATFSLSWVFSFPR